MTSTPAVRGARENFKWNEETTMTRTILTGGAVLILSAAMAFSGCKKDEKNNDAAMLLGLAALNPQSQAVPTYTAEQTQAAATAQTASSVATSAATSVSSLNLSAGAFRKLEVAHLVTDIVKNGQDPVYAKEAAKEYFLTKMKNANSKKTEESPARLAAITQSNITPTAGTYKNTCANVPGGTGTYTTCIAWGVSISGASLDGQNYVTQTMSYDFSQPMYAAAYPNLAGCKFDVTVITASGVKGTASLNGTMNYAMKTGGTYPNTVSYVKMDNNLTFGFSNFGTVYVDMLEMLRMYKELSKLTTIDQTKMTCDQLKIFAGMTNLYKAATINSGTMTVVGTSEFDNTQSGTYSSTTSVYKGTSSTKVQSTDLVIDSQNVSIDTTFAVNQNFTMTSSTAGYTPSGSATISLSGTVNGTAVNTTITVTF